MVIILKSIYSLIKNPKLLIPDIISIIISFILGTFFLKFNNLFSKDIYNSEIVKEIAYSIINNPDNSIKFFSSLIIALVLAFLVNLGITSIRFVLIKKTMKNKKLNLYESYKESHLYIWKIFFIRLFLALLYLVPLAALIFILNFLKFEISFILTMVLLLSSLFLIYLNSVFVFVYPILVLKNKKTAFAIKESYLYFKKNKAKCFFTFLFVSIISYSLSLIINFIVIYSGIIVYDSYSILGYIVSIAWLIKSILNSPINVWQDLYIFGKY